MKQGIKQIKNIINKLFCKLKSPDNFVQIIKTKDKFFIVTYLAFIVIGIMLHQHWQFPHFYGFVAGFSFILILSIISILHYSMKMNSIVSKLGPQPPAKQSNYFYLRHAKESWLYVFGPLCIVLVFGSGGCIMFGAIQVTPTLIWILVLFFVTVYISIIGYLQYIFLAIYIMKLACNSERYKNLEKKELECIPSQQSWLQELTKLSHTYRNAFFTLGSAYIIAFSAFCWLPEMQANRNFFAFYLLWCIIFLVIVLLFPIVSMLEVHWIKIIVQHLKNDYIKDYEQEIQLCRVASVHKNAISQQLEKIIFVNQIINSKDYPISSVWTNIYATTLSIFNFGAAIATVVQIFPFTMLLNAL